MASESLSAKLVNAKVMIEALKANQGKVTKVDASFIEEMEQIRSEVEKYNIEQERLKGELKTTTAKLNEKLKSLNEKYNFAKKRVKVDIIQTTWREFGITDTK